MKHVVLAVLLVLLVGCGGDPQPHFSSAPPTLVPTTTAPAVETPQAFLRRWVHAMDTMERTGKPAPWEALNLRSCKDCATVAATVRGVYAGGYHVAGSRSRVKSVVHLRGGIWQARVFSQPTDVLDRSGRKRGGYPGGWTTLQVTLVCRSGALRVASVVRRPS
ncbi:hypothetical protein GCM10028801_27910 [Nocardioides maradonensis]